MTVIRGVKGCREYTVLDGVTSTDSGSWVDVSAWRRITIHIKGIITATCQIRGSCEPTKPPDTDDGVQIGSDITSDTLYEITAKMKYIKVKVSAYTAGTIYAYAVGEELMVNI